MGGALYLSGQNAGWETGRIILAQLIINGKKKKIIEKTIPDS